MGMAIIHLDSYFNKSGKIKRLKNIGRSPTLSGTMNDRNQGEEAPCKFRLNEEAIFDGKNTFFKRAFMRLATMIFNRNFNY